MKLCKVGIHKWKYISPPTSGKKYRKCIYCNKYQIKDLSIPFLWWTIKNK